MLKTALAFAGSLVVAACGDDPLTPSQVRARITDDLGNVLRESAAATDATGESAPDGAALALIDRMIESGGSAGSVMPRPGALLDRLDQVVVRRKRAPADGEAYDADVVTSRLNDELFTDANHQGDGIYAVPPELVCTHVIENDDGTTGEAVDRLPAGDPECADNLAKAQLRVRVSEQDSALQLALQIGADHDEPLRFTLTHSSLAVTLDLDDAGHALTALAPLVGEQVPNTSLSGEVTGVVEILAAASARFELTIDRRIEIKAGETGVDLDGRDAFRFTSARAAVAAVTLDGATGSGAMTLGLGETTLHLPGDQTYDLDLPGVSLIAMMIPTQPVQLTRIGLGERTTTISIEGRQAIAIDLNPDDGRALGATITRDPSSGLETLAVTPRLDLRYAVDHGVLGDERPVYDVTRIVLDGRVRGAEDSDRVEVVSGTFSIATNPEVYGFTATTGQCVTSTPVEDVTSGAHYDQWTAGTCN